MGDSVGPILGLGQVEGEVSWYQGVNRVALLGPSCRLLNTAWHGTAPPKDPTN